MWLCPSPLTCKYCMDRHVSFTDILLGTTAGEPVIDYVEVLSQQHNNY